MSLDIHCIIRDGRFHLSNYIQNIKIAAVYIRLKSIQSIRSKFCGILFLYTPMPKVIIISDLSECPSVGQNLNRVWSISPILLAAGIPNSVCGYTVGSLRVTYCFWGRNPKFGVWIYFRVAKCGILF